MDELPSSAVEELFVPHELTRAIMLLIDSVTFDPTITFFIWISEKVTPTLVIEAREVRVLSTSVMALITHHSQDKMYMSCSRPISFCPRAHRDLVGTVGVVVVTTPLLCVLHSALVLPFTCLGCTAGSSVA